MAHHHLLSWPRTIVLTILIGSASARADGIFDLARKPKQRVSITRDALPPQELNKDQPLMVRRIRGELAQLKPAQITELCACVDTAVANNQADRNRRGSSDALTAPSSTPLCFIHIDGPAGSRSIAISQSPDGVYRADEFISATTKSTEKDDAGSRLPAPEKPRHALLKPRLLDKLLSTLITDGVGFSGDLDQAVVTNEPRGEVFPLPKPYQFSAIQLDAQTIRSRIGSSPIIKYSPTARVLQEETFFARVPQSYNQRQPCGLLVYIDPAPSGRPPRAMWEGLDELGFICISPAAAGNNRFATERLQLGLDAVSTARRRWSIDPDRIYVSGVSGGGKMASESINCFPDIYRGAICIVGINWYENLPSGQGNKVWPAEFSKPVGRRWTQLLQHRIAAVTGSNDFNRAPVTAGVLFYQREKLNARLFDIEGLGHDLPSPGAFTQQLSWVDEVAREKAKRLSLEADDTLAAAHDEPDADRARSESAAVMVRYPWTAAAWRVWDATK